MKRWMNGWTHEWMNDLKDRRMDGWTVAKWTVDGRMESWIGRKMDEWMDKRMATLLK